MIQRQCRETYRFSVSLIIELRVIDQTFAPDHVHIQHATEILRRYDRAKPRRIGFFLDNILLSIANKSAHSVRKCPKTPTHHQSWV